MHKATWLLLGLGFLMHGGSRLMINDTDSMPFAITTAGRAPAPDWIQKISAGPFPGIAADYHILTVFNIHDQIQHDLPDAQKEIAWKLLAAHLDRSSTLDPRFLDTYRLTSGLLAYSGNGTQYAVDILEKGMLALPENWEIPFLAGFISHDALNDEEQALFFLKTATQRPGVPTIAIGLASKILDNEKGAEASILFLQYLLTTLPDTYHQNIQRRIQKLRKQSFQPHKEKVT